MAKYETITEAVEAKARCKAEIHDLSARIFRLKRDESISDDDFDDERLKLNMEIRQRESELEVIDAWVQEEGDRRRQQHREREQAGRQAKEQRALTDVERKRNGNEARTALLLEKAKAKQASAQAHEAQVKAAQERRDRRAAEYNDLLRRERDKCKDLLRVAVAALMDIDPDLPALRLIRQHEPHIIKGLESHGVQGAIERLAEVRQA